MMSLIFHSLPSVIIDQLHIVSVSPVPYKTESPIAADPKTELAVSIASKLFEKASRYGG